MWLFYFYELMRGVTLEGLGPCAIIIIVVSVGYVNCMRFYKIKLNSLSDMEFLVRQLTKLLHKIKNAVVLLNYYG